MDKKIIAVHDTMDKKIIAVIVVAIVVVAGVLVVFTQNNKSNDDTNVSAKGTFQILGNANNDLSIDGDDVKAIQKFISDGTTYKKADHYMYDANYDGKVNSADVDKVNAMIRAQSTGDWSEVKNVYYLNVDSKITSYDMTVSDKVITLIAPPLDSVLAMGGRDLVVGFDNRITTGKYHSEYAKTFDFSKMIDVGSCTEPDTEKISNAATTYGGVNVVCGTADSYGPNMESTFQGTKVQVIRVATWEYGRAMDGFMTLSYLLKHTDQALDYYQTFTKYENDVQEIVKLAPDKKKAAGGYGVSCAYGYTDELSLLGQYTGEYHCLAKLGGYDSTTEFLKGSPGGGHGDTITTEDVVAMWQNNHLRNLVLMIGAPFQVHTDSGNAQASQAYIKEKYNTWGSKIGVSTMDRFSYCVTGYSFSSGVAEYINEMIFAYYLYNDEFLAYYHCTTQKEAQDILAECVNGYCKTICIDELWSFYGEDNGGKTGTHGMNLLYCGEGDVRNIMYGLKEGSW